MIIKAENLYKKYYLGKIEVPVLNGISLDIEKGEYVIIKGRSGSGKSTLLYLLGLLDVPTKGKIFVKDIDIEKLSEAEKSNFRLNNFGYVFQDYALLPELNAWENVALPLLMQGVDKKLAKKKASDFLSSVGLEDKIENLPSQLSGGQQQRVSIARAISSEPEILFADEPTANLDSKTAEQVMAVFADLNKAGQTVVMVTHETEKAKGATRIINLSDGGIK
jgi:putative ABC transport system ATP-binding protein